jgi:hypothetical protein
LELGGAEGLGTWVGGQQVSNPLEQRLGLRSQGFDQTLGFVFLLLGQGRLNHGGSFPLEGLSWVKYAIPPLVYK